MTKSQSHANKKQLDRMMDVVCKAECKLCDFELQDHQYSAVSKPPYCLFQGEAPHNVFVFKEQSPYIEDLLRKILDNPLTPKIYTDTWIRVLNHAYGTIYGTVCSDYD